MKIEDENYIVFSNVSKSYLNGEVYVHALKNTSFSIAKGELVIVLGNSGAGKSTALNLLGGMDQATSGCIYVDGTDITKYSLDELTDYRRKEIGFVFQFYNLIQNLTVRENILLATEISDEHKDIDSLLERVGLKDRMNNFPSQLSGGEQQRTSLVRAMIKKPKILLCDEPTGALDYKTSKEVLRLIQDICIEEKITVIIITHNDAISPMANKIIKFKSGSIISIEENSPVYVDSIEW